MAESDNLALYRLWRPQTFSEMVAQEQVVFPLRQSVITGKFSHALLLSGTRGTGKTSLAKIFAKAINCLDPHEGDPCNACEICLAANDGSLMDINEIDAASHNSVDHIRRLTEEIIFTPVRTKYKVYIIDEVHMLSQGAFNALLKTLEEPPSHAVFIMATTEPHRIPATIISRSQHFQFRRISQEEMVKRMREIASSIDLAIEDEALEVIALLSGGALRDAISLLDQTRQAGAEVISRDQVLQLAGRVPDQFLSETAQAMIDRDPETLLTRIQELVMSGRDLARFVIDLGGHFRNLLVCRVSSNPHKLIQMQGKDIQALQATASKTSPAVLTDFIAGLAELQTSLRFSPDMRTSLEIGLIRLSSLSAGRPKEEKISEPAQKEQKIAKDPPPKADPIEPVQEEKSSLPPAPPPAPLPVQAPVQTEAASPSHDTIATDKGDEPLLDVWRDILELLQREKRIDISLCARPARVYVNKGTFEIRFENKLFGQYACLNKKECTALIEQLLGQRTGRHYPVRVALDEAQDKAVGASAEWAWLAKAREKALADEIPPPHPAED